MGDDHLSGALVTERLGATLLVGRAIRPPVRPGIRLSYRRIFERSCFRWGLPEGCVTAALCELLPHNFTLTAKRLRTLGTQFCLKGAPALRACTPPSGKAAGAPVAPL
jgi:hypothetical protein